MSEANAVSAATQVHLDALKVLEGIAIPLTPPRAQPEDNTIVANDDKISTPVSVLGKSTPASGSEHKFDADGSPPLRLVGSPLVEGSPLTDAWDVEDSAEEYGSSHDEARTSRRRSSAAPRKSVCFASQLNEVQANGGKSQRRMSRRSSTHTNSEATRGILKKRSSLKKSSSKARDRRSAADSDSDDEVFMERIDSLIDQLAQVRRRTRARKANRELYQGTPEASPEVQVVSPTRDSSSPARTSLEGLEGSIDQKPNTASDGALGSLDSVPDATFTKNATSALDGPITSTLDGIGTGTSDSSTDKPVANELGSDEPATTDSAEDNEGKTETPSQSDALSTAPNLNTMARNYMLQHSGVTVSSLGGGDEGDGEVVERPIVASAIIKRREAVQPQAKTWYGSIPPANSVQMQPHARGYANSQVSARLSMLPGPSQVANHAPTSSSLEMDSGRGVVSLASGSALDRVGSSDWSESAGITLPSLPQERFAKPSLLDAAPVHEVESHLGGKSRRSRRGAADSFVMKATQKAFDLSAKRRELCQSFGNAADSGEGKTDENTRPSQPTQAGTQTRSQKPSGRPRGSGNKHGNKVLRVEEMQRVLEGMGFTIMDDKKPAKKVAEDNASEMSSMLSKGMERWRKEKKKSFFEL